REGRTGDRLLVAYVVESAGVRTQLSDLKSALRDKLPGYMVPSAIVRLDALPLLPSGKVDRRALPALDESPGAERLHVAPRGPFARESAQPRPRSRASSGEGSCPSPLPRSDSGS